MAREPGLIDDRALVSASEAVLTIIESDSYTSAGRTAAYAARAAAAAARYAGEVHFGYFEYAAEYAFIALGDHANVVAKAERRDYEGFLELARQHHWDDSTPVDPDILGPLWTNGEPAGWRKSPQRAAESNVEAVATRQPIEPRLQLRVATLPLADTPENREALKVHLRELVKAANLVNRERGGPGLEIARAKITSPAGVTTGVGHD